MPQMTDGYEVCNQIPPVLYTKGPVTVLKFKQEYNQNVICWYTTNYSATRVRTWVDMYADTAMKEALHAKGVGRFPGVERPKKFLPRVARRNFLTYLFFTYEETALVASRYVEGHALTLCIYTVTV